MSRKERLLGALIDGLAFALFVTGLHVFGKEILHTQPRALSENPDVWEYARLGLTAFLFYVILSYVWLGRRPENYMFLRLARFVRKIWPNQDRKND